jgi:hypothetical protein
LGTDCMKNLCQWKELDLIAANCIATGYSCHYRSHCVGAEDIIERLHLERAPLLGRRPGVRCSRLAETTRAHAAAG